MYASEIFTHMRKAQTYKATENAKVEDKSNISSFVILSIFLIWYYLAIHIRIHANCFPHTCKIHKENALTTENEN